MNTGMSGTVSRTVSAATTSIANRQATTAGGTVTARAELREVAPVVAIERIQAAGGQQHQLAGAGPPAGRGPAATVRDMQAGTQVLLDRAADPLRRDVGRPRQDSTADEDAGQRGKDREFGDADAAGERSCDGGRGGPPGDGEIAVAIPRATAGASEPTRDASGAEERRLGLTEGRGTRPMGCLRLGRRPPTPPVGERRARETVTRLRKTW